MLYKNTKAIVCSPNDNSNFFKIVAGILQGVALALYMFTNYLNYIIQMLIDLMKEDGFTFKKTRRQYPAETMTDAVYTDDLVLLANTSYPNQISAT